MHRQPLNHCAKWHKFLTMFSLSMLKRDTTEAPYFFEEVFFMGVYKTVHGGVCPERIWGCPERKWVCPYRNPNYGG